MPRKRQRKKAPAYPRPRMRPAGNAQLNKQILDITGSGSMLILGTGVLGMARGAMPPGPCGGP